MTPEESKPGTRVRVIGTPERTGTIISDQPLENEGTWRVRVEFDDGVRRATRVDNLEPIPRHRDIMEDISRGQFEGPESLRRNLLHEKLNGRLSDVLYSMDTSDTTFLAYQFKPILKLLESPTNSLLIADEVGLGKTIEAGLIWTELRAREGARTLLVVCPPHLITKWQQELKRRFGVDAKKAGPAEVEEALDEARRGTTSGFALVASYHGLRPTRDWEDSGSGATASLAKRLSQWADEEEPFLDLLVMDEAAIMRNEGTQISELGGLLAPICRYKVYLSATPLHTRSRNLFTLLKRLDPDTFSEEQTFGSLLEANAPLVRLRECLLVGNATRASLIQSVDQALTHPLLQRSHTLKNLRRRLEETPSLEDPKIRAELAYQSERANLLSYVVTRTRKRDVEIHPVIREVNTVLVPLTAVELAFYQCVTDAVWEYASAQGISSGFLTVMPQRQVASCMAAAWQKLSAGSVDTEELNPDYSNSTRDDETGPLIAHLRKSLAGRFRTEDFRGADSKYERLRDALRTYWEAHPGKKLVLFAFFKPTLYYLQGRLAQDGIPSLLLTGDVTGDKQAIVDKFSDPNSAPILLSSEVGGEGLDLQFASALVNYDLPWNPMIVEQRIGRIHRIGQEAERIVVINMVCEDTVDQRIYERLYERLHLFHRTLGDLEEVIGPLINELTKDILSHRLSDQQLQQRIEQTAVALEQKFQDEEKLEQDASILAAYGDYVVNQIASAHERGEWVTGSDLEAYIRGFFHRNFPATRFQGIDPQQGTFEIELDLDALHEFDRFLGEHHLRGQTGLTTTQRRKVRFDHRVFTAQRSGIEVIHQAHPLVRFASHYLRVQRVVQPVPVAIELPPQHRPKGVEPGVYAFVSQRWAVEGLRHHECIHHEMFSLLDEKPIPERQTATTIVELAAALGVAVSRVPEEGDDLLSTMAERIGDLEFEAENRFQAFEQTCRHENEDRKRIQLQGVNGFEERRRVGIERRREGHQLAGRENLVAAMEGQLASLRLRCDADRDKIERRARTVGECNTIAAGFIQVH